jgi:hypothetical protein
MKIGIYLLLLNALYLLTNCSKCVEKDRDTTLTQEQYYFLSQPEDNNRLVWINSILFDTTQVKPTSVDGELIKENKGMLWNPSCNYTRETGTKEILNLKKVSVITIKAYSENKYSHGLPYQTIQIQKQDTSSTYFKVDLYATDLSSKNAGGFHHNDIITTVQDKDTLWYSKSRGIVGWSEYLAKQKVSKVVYRLF